MTNVINLHKDKNNNEQLEDIEEFRDILIESNLARYKLHSAKIDFDVRWDENSPINKERTLILHHLCRLMMNKRTSKKNRIRCAEIVHNLNPYRCTILALVKELQDENKLNKHDDNWLAKNYLYQTANQYYYGFKHKIDDIFGIK
mgnify:FL=1|tara:strand:+ start:1210 stop:1644 length:435 start_codon:yes stop_codon:yes gene_type:complete